MNVIRSIFSVIRDLGVGDDWRMSLGVVVVLATTATVHAAGFVAWWLLPIGVVMVLVLGVSGSTSG